MTEKSCQAEETIRGQSFFSSWSAGKDSCLAFYRAIQAGGKPKLLFTMFLEGGERSHSHGLAAEVVQAQAAALGLPLLTRAASWADYETAFLDGLQEIRQTGTEVGVFGDIDGEPHLEWVLRICGLAGVTPWEPIWKSERRKLLHEFLDAGFKATVVSVKEALLKPDYLGRTLDRNLIAEFEAQGIDACGENGEYHTVVTDGPVFSAPLKLEHKERVLRSGYWFLDLAITAK